MESIEGGLDFKEVILVQHIPMNKIVKIQECAERLDDLLWNKTLDCGHPDLWYYEAGEYMAAKSVGYLHQRLGVIPSPLAEVSAILESAESWKGRCE